MRPSVRLGTEPIESAVIGTLIVQISWANLPMHTCARLTSASALSGSAGNFVRALANARIGKWVFVKYERERHPFISVLGIRGEMATRILCVFNLTLFCTNHRKRFGTPARSMITDSVLVPRGRVHYPPEVFTLTWRRRHRRRAAGVLASGRNTAGWRGNPNGRNLRTCHRI